MSVFERKHLKQKEACIRRAVALDMDGVIIDGMQFHTKAWKKAFGIYNIEVTPTEVYLLEGIKSPEVVEIVCSKKEIRLSNLEKNNIVDVKRKIYTEIFRVVPLTGSVILVRKLHSYGYSLALVTGTLREAAEKTLHQLQIEDCFSHIVASENVARGKPSAEPYLQALSMLGTNSSKCLAIENSPPGIRSAKAAGLSCIAIATYLPVDYLSEADMVFRNITESTLWFESEYCQSKGQDKWVL